MRPTCRVTNCDRPVKSREWCASHYMRWHRRGGDPSEDRRSPKEAPAHRFWRKVEKIKSCWLWRGAIQRSNGYGRFWDGERVLGAHQFIYRLTFGQIPDGLEIDHLCRVRNCVNPNHLEAVTRRINTLRGESLPARQSRKTHCDKGHPLAGANLIRRGNHRTCRICANQSQRERRRSVPA
jgi:hypothetical protein